jgi:hypothetical protein
MQKSMLASAACATFLSACGGSGPNATATIGVTPPTYATLANTSGGNSEVSGGAVSSDDFSTTALDGTFAHASNSVFFTTPSGGTASASTADFNTYDYARPIDINVGGTVYAGVFGIETSAADVARSTDATYTVEFEGVYLSGTSPETLANWSGTLTADFGSNDVDMSVTGAGSAAIDQFTVTDATISGSQITGGTLSTLQGGSAVDVTGTSSGLNATFFGFDGVLFAPDEVGGVISSQGSGPNAGNTLTGAFIGD